MTERSLILEIFEHTIFPNNREMYKFNLGDQELETVILKHFFMDNTIEYNNCEGLVSLKILNLGPCLSIQ